MGNLGIEIKEELLQAAEPDYQRFQSGLIPGVGDILGVRIPKLRQLAKGIARGDWQTYLDENHDDTYEERMLQGMVIGYARMTEEEQKKRLDTFVPKIDNWAICDCCTSTYKFMKKNQEQWFSYLMEKLETGTEFSIRFVVVALMDYYITEEWIDRVLKVYKEIQHDGYYVKMAVAWAVSMCYISFPRKTRTLLEEGVLEQFTHNKAIQKIRESYRVSREEKEELKQLKR